MILERVYRYDVTVANMTIRSITLTLREVLISFVRLLFLHCLYHAYATVEHAIRLPFPFPGT
jgi:hypothetical protein